MNLTQLKVTATNISNELKICNDAIKCGILKDKLDKIKKEIKNQEKCTEK
jgi:hypothetical protein